MTEPRLGQTAFEGLKSNFYPNGKKIFVVYGNELDAHGMVQIGFAVKVDADHSPSTGKSKEERREVSPPVIARQRFNTGKYRFYPPLSLRTIEGEFSMTALEPAPVRVEPSAEYTVPAAALLSQKIEGWLQAEGTLVRIDSIQDLIRRGRFIRRPTTSVRYKAWETLAVSAVSRADSRARAGIVLRNPERIEELRAQLLGLGVQIPDESA